MATFVHLAPETQVAKIRRNGIRPSRWHVEEFDRVVFAMPVTENFFLSHQWLRELKAAGARTICGIYFRVPDEEPVLVGHYGAAHQAVAAIEAVAHIRDAECAEGFEVLIPRRVEAREITRTKHLPQVVGWRHYPGAHGAKPCGCSFCQRDARPGARKLRDAYDRDQDES